MSIVSDHPIWQRKRRNHHGGAWRDYMKDTNNECASPRGPGTAPFQCSKCHDPSSKGNSPMVTSDYYSCSSQSSSEDETFNSSFNMQGTCGNLRNCGWPFGCHSEFHFLAVFTVTISNFFYGIHLMEIIFYGASQLFVKMPKYEIIVNIFEHTSKQSGEGWGTIL